MVSRPARAPVAPAACIAPSSARSSWRQDIGAFVFPWVGGSTIITMLRHRAARGRDRGAGGAPARRDRPARHRWPLRRRAGAGPDPARCGGGGGPRAARRAGGSDQPVRVPVRRPEPDQHRDRALPGGERRPRPRGRWARGIRPRTTASSSPTSRPMTTTRSTARPMRTERRRHDRAKPASPGARRAAAYHFPNFIHRPLDNGLTVWVVPLPDRDMVSVHLWSMGARRRSPRREGGDCGADRGVARHRDPAPGRASPSPRPASGSGSSSSPTRRGTVARAGFQSPCRSPVDGRARAAGRDGPGAGLRRGRVRPDPRGAPGRHPPGPLRTGTARR